MSQVGHSERGDTFRACQNGWIGAAERDAAMSNPERGILLPWCEWAYSVAGRRESRSGGYVN